MPEMPVLSELLVLAGVSLVALFLAQRLRLPPLLAFLATGLIVGPSGFSLVRDEGLVHILAELGVVLLLFTAGLEISLSELRRLGRIAFLGGAIQIAAILILAWAASFVFHTHPAQALFVGMVVAVSSSTAVVFKLLADRHELDSPHGRLCVGLLVLQDLAGIAFVVAVPLLGQWSHGRELFGFTDSRHILRLTSAAVTAVLMFFVARRAIPWLLHRASRAGSRETFLFAVLVVVLGSAGLAAWAGASLAIGAFLAGLVLARSDLRSLIAADVLPFRDAFASVFFIGIGMSLDLWSILANPLLVLGTTFGLLTLKAASGFAGLRLAGAPGRVAAAAALTTAQIGEFSFLLLQAGQPAGLMSETGAQALTAAAVFSLALTPFVVARANPWAIAAAASGARAAPAARAATPGAAEAAPPLTDHVVIAGYGLNGQNLARVLRKVHLPHLVLDLNPDSAREAIRDGSPALIGDITRMPIQEEAGIPTARVLVLALSDPVATAHACSLARRAAQNLFIVVRTRYVAEIDRLHSVGASQVIPEEFETSIEIFTSVLREYHVPRNVVNAQVQMLRQERYSLLRGQRLTASVVEQLDAILSEGVTDTFLLLQHSPVLGLPPGELPFVREGSTGLVAVVRNGQAHTEYPEDFQLRVGDTLVLTGTHADMELAFAALGTQSV